MPKIKSSVISRQWPTIVTAENHGSLRYRVDCRPVEGRKFFSDRAEALAFATELARLRDEGGSTALSVPAALRADAVEAAAILEPYGKTLLDAARFLAAYASIRAIGGGRLRVAHSARGRFSVERLGRGFTVAGESG